MTTPVRNDKLLQHQRDIRTLMSVVREDEKQNAQASDCPSSNSPLPLYKRLRMTRKPESDSEEEDSDDMQLKKLGLYEKGMTKQEKQTYLSAVAASEKSAIIECEQRKNVTLLDTESDEERNNLNCDHSGTKKSTFVDVEGHSDSPMSPLLFNEDSNNSTQIIGQENETISDGILRSAKSMNEDGKKEKTIGDITMRRLSSHNDYSPDEIIRKYDRKPINPLDFAEEIPAVNLVDKRIVNTKGITHLNCVRPGNVSPASFAKTIINNLDSFRQKLHALQRRSLDFAEWGPPVVVGKHCPESLDVYHHKQRLNRLEDNLEDEDGDGAAKRIELKDEQSPKKSDSDDDFKDSLTQKQSKTGVAGSKFNFIPKLRTYMKNSRENPKPANVDIFDFEDESSGEDVIPSSVLQSMTRVEMPQNRLSHPKKLSANAKSDSDGDEWIPNKQARRRPLRLNRNAASGSGAVGNFLTESTFYGKKRAVADASQLINKLVDVSVKEMPAKNLPPATSAGLDDKMPNVKVKVNKVGLSRKWVRMRNDPGKPPSCEEKPLEPTKLDLEIEIVDDEKKVTAAAKPSETANRGNGRPTRRLANLPNRSAPGTSGTLSKRPRLEMTNDGEEREQGQGQGEGEERPGSSSSLNLQVPKMRGEKSRSEEVACPLCNKMFAKDVIEQHASDCEGIVDEDLPPTRTPKNKIRCYICRRVFSQTEYSDHVRKCVRDKKEEMSISDEDEEPELKSDVGVSGNMVENLTGKDAEFKWENNSQSVFFHLNRMSENGEATSRRYNHVAARSSPLNIGSLSTPPTNFDISLTHVTTPTIQMFKPISQLKDSSIDFKNQFPICKQRKRRNVKKAVKTKKRKKNSIKGKKTPKRRKSK